MDCPNCETWNPDDKIKCWRCGTEMPSPEPKKKRRTRIIMGLPAWIWTALALVLLVWLFFQCAAPGIPAQ